MVPGVRAREASHREPAAGPVPTGQLMMMMTRTMQVVTPRTMRYVDGVTPGRLGLYRFVSSCFSIIQQYVTTGRVGFRLQAAGQPAVAPAAAAQPPGRFATRTRRASE